MMLSGWLTQRFGVVRTFTYALFGLATIHGIAAGTDTTRPWATALYLGALGSVVAATAWRALVPPTRRPVPAVTKGATP